MFLRRADGATPLILLLAGASLLLFLRLGVAPIERAEIYFVDAARGMVESGDWLVPRYRGEPFFDKPALAYWLMAAAMKVLGVGLGAARVVPALAALGVLAATWGLGRRLFSPRAALLAVVVEGTTLLFLSFARLAMSDMLMTLWSTLSVLLGVMLLRDGRASTARQAMLGATLGLGFLTKGPVALLLPGCALIAFWWPRRRERLPLSAAGVTSATLLFAACGLGWFALLAMRMGAGPLAWFFLHENLDRFAGETYDSGRPAIFYLGAWLAVGLPWSLFAPLAAWRLRAGERPLLGWVGLALLPLSVSHGKIDYYLLPLSPAVSLAVGAWLDRESGWTRLDRHWARVALALFAAGMAAVARLDGRLPTAWLPGPGARSTLVATALLVAMLALAASWRPRAVAVTAVIAGGSAALALLLVAAYLPSFRAQQPNAAVVSDVARELRYRPDASLAYCSDPARAERDVLFEARLAADHTCELWPVASSKHPYLLLLDEQERASLAAVPGFREVSRYTALPATALTLRTLVSGVQPTTFVLAANFATTDPVSETKQQRERKKALADEEEARLAQREALRASRREQRRGGEATP